ncbi:MAG: antitoxin [Acutalibacteraceae bacterium]|nr:antitoxin [Acutalibacteraceae bacterium]
MAKTAYERNKNAIKKYLAEKTDDIRVRVPKGKKDEYKSHAQSKGMSLNAYIIGLIEADIKKEQGE